MKKTLIALAVLAASTASMAQVTLYGVVDAAIGSSDKTSAASGSAFGQTNTGTRLLTNGSLTNGNSRWGMKGTEDLGGGLKAGFVLEGSIDIADGANAGSGSKLFSRSSYASLSGNFGELKAGRQYNPTFYALAAWDLTGVANYSVAANQFGGVISGGFRDNAMVSYSTPTMGGFKVIAGYVPQGNAQFGTATDPKSKYDIAAIYAAGPLAGALAYNKVDNGAENTTLGVNYNFGAFIVAGSWNSGKDGAGNKVIEGYTLGASVPMGQWKFTADIANVQNGSALLPGNSSDTNYLLEVNYFLSKSTFIYGAYVSDQKGINSQDNSAYSIGMRKNF